MNKMTSLKFVFYLMCLFLGKMAGTTDLSSSVRQERGFVSTHVGETVTLQCFYDAAVVAKYYWYKQIWGQTPRLICTFFVYDKNGTFYEEFKNNARFTLDAETGKNHLTISDLRTSDSATYYCVSSYSITFEFVENLILSVKDSRLNNQALVHQSSSETVQPGGSVTLSCTVHTGTCDDEHSVYWIRNSEESQPGLIYTHGDRNDQCERKPDTQTHTCVYNLSLKRLNLSHAGTYYCAFASCGQIVFGNGTKLNTEDEEDFPPLVYFLSSALAFTSFISIILAFLLCMINKRNSCQATESHARFSAFSTANAESGQNDENIHYAALSVKKFNSSRRQKDDKVSECVYSRVKQ
ncbi:uncharacterized protein LOC121177235 [Toxotes jaculatrix]|uniref:uncharacterized protein LOC121177235 n=1 Tax=Toxotes jaculatrix TaxID=941984 RepID=UPI001B3AFBB9|nr:uncharacterized protein LOC121177235 [Toxotes jaculatrix]